MKKTAVMVLFNWLNFLEGGEWMKKRKFGLFFLVSAVFLVCLGQGVSYASPLVYFEQELFLSNSPDYDWWYGCSPTSAGMMMGYYDINGYSGLRYDNLVPGGTAELNTFGSGSFAVNDIIASSGHIADFYSGGYLASGDDNYTGRSFDCLADFMGTSQDSLGNVNGSTTFFHYTNGARLYVADLYSYGSSIYNRSGLFGMWEYFDYTGYGSSDPSTDYNFFSQPVDTFGLTYGFTFADYIAEIDAGRVVMICTENHSMFGYGYDALTQTIYIHDTWSAGEHTMNWGGSYGGKSMLQVVCFIPTGGTVEETDVVPEPASFLLLGFGVVGLVGFGRLKKKGM